MFEKSIIVSAHPDDEILWFSSIIDKVDDIVICFLECKSVPLWTVGRKKSLSEYPLKNITCLGVDESGAFDCANWKNPVITEFGLEISQKTSSNKKYIKNYYTLREILQVKLRGYSNVFTHNPWGEYGHEEHVQLYRVVKELQEQMKFNLWFSNYCSNKSLNLMLRYISGFDSTYSKHMTNKDQANKIMDIYKRNQCWTWYQDWEWFNEEFFKKDTAVTEKASECGHIFPLNMIKVELPNKSSIKDKIFKKIVFKAKRNNK